MFSAISAIATLTCSGNATSSLHGLDSGYSSSRRSPCCWCVLADARHLPHGRSQAGDRHLNFYETREYALQFERGCVMT